MKQLLVHYCGWGEDWPLGRLADDGQALLFEYSPKAIDEGLELSPLRLKLSPHAYGAFAPHQHRLPGLIADCLPDGWGMLLMDRLFRQQGIRDPSPLDRLAFIGDRALGALRFAPPSDIPAAAPDWSLLQLAQQSARALAGDAAVALRELAVTGGSPQGARPKALVQFDPTTKQISTRCDAPGQTWLVKFPAHGEHAEVCAIEQMYADLARDCGLEMPSSHWFDLGNKFAAFGVQRFDRHNGLRVPIHSLAGLLHVDFRLPGAADYTTLLRATRLLTRDEREVEKAFARAVFNVMFHNRDDHPKNHAWRLGHDRRWTLAPAFDLTFSHGPRGEHHMDICGEGSSITRSHLRQLAREGGVQPKLVDTVIESMQLHAASFAQRTANAPIRRATAQQLNRAVEACSKRLL